MHSLHNNDEVELIRDFRQCSEVERKTLRAVACAFREAHQEEDKPTLLPAGVVILRR